QCVRIPCMGDDAKIPGSFKVKSYPVREENGYIWMWWGEERQTYPEIPWIDEIPRDEKEGMTRDEVWPFNYARLCQNHLDANHWAYVHDSIMVGVGEYFDTFNVNVEEDGLLIRTWGTLKRGSSERNKKQKGWSWKTYFRFPNVSMIQVTPRYKSLIIQTP